jgi:hypothetical protein
MRGEPNEIERLAGALAAAIRRARAFSLPPLKPHAIDGLDADLSLLHREHDPFAASLSSHRKRLGPPIVAIKRLARELLAQIFARQARYNAANARVVSYLMQRAEELERELEALRKQFAQFKHANPALSAGTVVDPVVQATGTSQQALERGQNAAASPCERAPALGTPRTPGDGA